jgi:hypothetical protein
MMQQLHYNNGTECFYVIFAEMLYEREKSFCTRGCEEKARSREAEESPLLEAVTRERLNPSKSCIIHQSF